MARWLPLAFCACALSALGFAAVSCGGSSGAKTISGTPGTTATASGSGTAANTTPDDPKAAPILKAPASLYSINLDDLGTAFFTDISQTYVLTLDSYAAAQGAFSSATEGKKDLTDWGYLGGYETAYIPEGRETAVLQGQYYITIESHLFKSEAGAKQAYDYFNAKLKSSVSTLVSGPQVGNESAVWKLVSGTIPTSTTPAAYHRLIFRRGNLVSIVLTFGADPFMTTQPVHDLAVIVDQKALGKKAVVEPTPTSNFTPNPADAPTPAGTSATGAGH